jgi:secreted trypsin-like serine protease
MFRKPDDPRTTPLEGISGPGDSGGPAFITVNGKPCIAGVSSNQRIELSGPPPKDGSPGGNGEDVQGRYGVTEVYTRVSKYVSWIRQTMSAN